MSEDLLVKYPGVSVVSVTQPLAKVVSVATSTPTVISVHGSDSSGSELSYYSTWLEIDGGLPDSVYGDGATVLDGGTPFDA